MKLIIDIKDSKAILFIEYMKSLDFIKGVKEMENGSISENTTYSDAAEESLVMIMKKKTETDTKSPAQKKEKFKAFQDLLLNGPVMDSEQYKEYLQLRHRLNLWRQK